MKPTHIFIYLLRIWQAGHMEKPEWRASLEEPHTHQIKGFDSLTQLCQYLLNLTEPAPKNEE